MESKREFDYVVIGAGSAGCVVSARLAEERLGTVLLIEAGQSCAENPEIMTADGFKYTFSNESTMWDRMSCPQTGVGGRALYCGSGRGMGGSGSVNGMVYTRGDRLDFAQWPRNWHWDDVRPFFESLEQRLGIRHREPTAFTEACIASSIRSGFELKNGLNDGELSGYMGYNDMNFQGNQRRSSYMAFIHGREEELDLLTISTGTRLRKIVFDEHRTAVGVELVEHGETIMVKVNREVILCSGALETPKLLMLSGVGPRAELQRFSIPEVADIATIGKNLQDHPNVCIFYKTNRPIDFYFPQVYGFRRINCGADLPENQADVCYTFFSVPSVIQETLKKMVPRMVLPARLHAIRKLRFGIRKLVDLAFRIPLVNHFVDRVFGIIVILGKPASRGEVRLNSGNPEDDPLVNLAYYADPADAETMLVAIRRAHEIAMQPELQEWGSRLLSRAALSSRPGQARKWMYGATMTTYHYSGTCTMGESPEAPVATNLKLKGFNNLRIADASVIPEVPVSATNAPSMMIGYRAVEFIRQEVSRKGDDLASASGGRAEAVRSQA